MKKIFVSISFCLIALITVAQQLPVNVKKVSAKDVKAMIDSSTGPLIVSFWASWCGPCIREIPWLESQVAQSTIPVKLLLVSLDLPQLYPKQFNDFLKQKGYHSEVWVLKEAKVDYLAIAEKWTGSIPASIFVDNSKKYYRFFNMQLTEKRLEAELKNMLN